MKRLVFECAGALFGELLERIPCGSVEMWFNRDAKAFGYGWRLHAKGKYLYVHYYMSALEIHNMRWCDDTPTWLAEKIVELWRAKLDKVPV